MPGSNISKAWMMADQSISFGDHVRVRSTPLTEERGLAGLDGNVHGETTPSVTGVEVIGELKSDYAINVFLMAWERGIGSRQSYSSFLILQLARRSQ